MHGLLEQVLAAFTLLATTKIAVDLVWNDPDAVGEAAAVLGLGSILAAVLLITP